VLRWESAAPQLLFKKLLRKMVQGIDNVLKLYRDANLPFWRLYEGWEIKPTNCIAESKGSDSQTDRTSSEANLKEVIQMQMPGKYLLSVREKFNSSQSGVNIKFEVPYANGMTPAIGNLTNAIPAGYVHPSEMKLEIMKLQHEYEMKEFNRKLDEIQEKRKPKEDAVGKFLTQYGPTILGVLANKFGVNAGTQVSLAGFEQMPQQQVQPQTDTTETPTNKIPVTADEKMHWVITTLAEKEGSPEAAAELLYRFTHYTLQNQQQYELFKPMILKTEPIHG
jgi:hypothetical protein